MYFYPQNVLLSKILHWNTIADWKGLHCKQSKFFEAAFNKSFAEASNSAINLPKELPRTFEIVHTWLYTGQLTRAMGTEDVECTPNHNIELYIFGDKHAMTNLCNQGHVPAYKGL